ncbi:MAG: hypothetical protein QXG58_04690 [Candidatus Bathyarchaeia archaeon]
MAICRRVDCLVLSGKGFGGFVVSRRGLAVPVTYLILFGSLLVLVSVAYGFAVARLRVEGAAFGVAVARRNMQALDDAVRLVAWNIGASRTVYMEDCGGIFQTEPNAGTLVLRLADGGGFSTLVFNGSVGRVLYALSALHESMEGTFVRGDGRALVGFGGSTQSQLFFARNGSVQQFVLRYRPAATVLASSIRDGKAYNIIRIYIISLNKTQPLTLGGGFNLKVSAAKVASTVHSFTFEGTVSLLALEAVYDGFEARVWLPIECTLEGAIVNVEVYICHVVFQVVSS